MFQRCCPFLMEQKNADRIVSIDSRVEDRIEEGRVVEEERFVTIDGGVEEGKVEEDRIVIIDDRVYMEVNR